MRPAAILHVVTTTAARIWLAAILAGSAGCGDEAGGATIDASVGPDASVTSDSGGGGNPDGGSVLTTCSDDTDCPAAEPACNISVGVCVDCHDDRGCSTPDPYCSAAGYCLECLLDTQCAAPTPRCGQLFGCVECLEHTDCPPERPQCELPPSGYRCLAPCRSDPDCATSGRGHRCDTSSGICVACFVDGDCAPGVCVDGACRGPR